ncbi:MAG TPA: carboxypeptidase-like regulatory domain-containing protein [Vicinamibacterales bacterium]|nr:carboxypeptidase-like regulatory domain-containing protein [Vicinamibacterales bacterium]
MRKISTGVVVAALSLLGIPVASEAAPAVSPQQPQGSVNGVAQGADRAPLRNYTVRIRNVSNGDLAGSTTSDAAGQFSFTGLQPGNYVVEVVDAGGRVVGLSPSLSVAAGAAVNVTVGASAVGALTAATGSGFSLFGLGEVASVAVVGAAGAAAVTAVVATHNPASPSR